MSITCSLLSSCAQTQELTGGEDDTAAPKPDSLGISPANKTLNFQSKTIVFQFNEFIKLNNPIETIRIVPNDSKIKATAKLKTLTLELLDTLTPNTTYAIYLNGTVQDLTEQNDSLLTYVFSTGNQIDTNFIQVGLKDDFTKQNLENILVGLYNNNDDPKKTEPRFFAKSKSDGSLKLDFLKPGEYAMFAFDDKNKNLLIDKNEKSGYFKNGEQTTVTIPDTSSKYRIGLFQPSKNDTILQFVGPGSFRISGKNVGRYTSQWSNGSEEKVKIVNMDSVIVYFKNNIRFEDSLSILPKKSLRWTEFDRKLKINGQLEKSQLFPNDSLVLNFNDALEKYSFFAVFNDSIVFVPKIVLQSCSTLKFFDFPKNAKSVKLTAKPKEIIGMNNSNSDTLKFEAKIFNSTELGTILLNFKKSKIAQSDLIIDVLDGTTIVKNYFFKKGQKLTLNSIKPGTYSLRVIEDLDQNKKWTPGNFDIKKESEAVSYYQTPIKVRIGWEIELEF